MLPIQVKASKKGGIVVIDTVGAMHPCLEPDELWSILIELAAGVQQAVVSPIPGTLRIQIKIRRNSLVVIDPVAEMHHCTDAHDLWDTVADIIENADVPENAGVSVGTTNALMVQEQNPEVYTDVDEDEYVIVDDSTNEVRDVIEEMVGDAAAELGAGLFKRLRCLSHRGAAPKPGNRASQGRVKRGDIY